MTKIVQIIDVAPHNYRQRTIVLTDHMTTYQLREMHYSFGMWCKDNKQCTDCECNSVHNFAGKYCPYISNNK